MEFDDDTEANPTGFGSVGTVLGGLAEKFGASVGAKMIYGEPVERDGVTVVPVGKATYGFGGGGGRNEGADGGGGGGGAVVQPVGYIEIKDGRTSFRPIRNWGVLAALAVAGGLVGFLLVRPLMKRILSSEKN